MSGRQAVIREPTQAAQPEPVRAGSCEDGDRGSGFRRLSVREQVAFSYFYLSDGVDLFTPDYRENDLTWGAATPDRAFRGRFLGSRVSTALAATGGAEGGTLHEIEFIRHRSGSPGHSSQQVHLLGMVWVREGAGIAGHGLELRESTVHLAGADIFQEIALGGERSYGFGRLRRSDVAESCKAAASSLWPTDPEAEIRLGDERPLRAHVPYREDQLFRGEIEVLAGREYRGNGGEAAFIDPGARTENAGYWFAPGSRLTGDGMSAQQDPWGRLVWVQGS